MVTVINIVNGTAGNDFSLAGNGNDFVSGGDGDDLLTGGPGADVFRYPAGIAVGDDTITDFVPADDTVSLAAGLGFAPGTAALVALQQVGVDAVLTPLGGSITFLGLSVAELSAADFVIVQERRIRRPHPLTSAGQGRGRREPRRAMITADEDRTHRR